MFDKINEFIGVRFNGRFLDGLKFTSFWWAITMVTIAVISVLVFSFL